MQNWHISNATVSLITILKKQKVSKFEKHPHIRKQETFIVKIHLIKSMATPKKILCVSGDINFPSRTPRDTTSVSGSLSSTLADVYTKGRR